MPSALPVPKPPVTAETARFWQAIGEGRLLLSRCSNCASVIWYPRRSCTSCANTNLEEFEASGRGTIYSYTINYRGESSYRDASPYVLAYVELLEGPRILTNIVQCQPDELEIGAAVEVVFDRAEDGETVLYRFCLTR